METRTSIKFLNFVRVINLEGKFCLSINLTLYLHNTES